MNKKELIQAEIIGLLMSTGRDGIKKLVDYLVDNGFFESPASTKFHGCYAGGLANHSLRVYELMKKYCTDFMLDAVSSNGQKPYPITGNNIIIAALLHDVCKIGAYIGTEKPYKRNRKQPKGHARLSIERIEKLIELEPIERMMILYHMGVYGLNEFYKEGDWQTGEFPLRGDHIACEGLSKEESQNKRYGQSLANAWFHNPVCKIMYFCDELATLEEKAVEAKTS